MNIPRSLRCGVRRTGTLLVSLVILLCSACLGSPIHARPKPVGASLYVKGGYSCILVPPAVGGKEDEGHNGSYPLILSLHGKSLRGRDISRLYTYGAIEAVANGLRVPAFILAPLCPRGEGWSSRRLHTLVHSVMRTYAIDTNRLYVVGMSMGGYGTFDFAGTYPDEVAAAIALCGGGKASMAANLSKVPLWVIHGTADERVPVTQSRSIVSAIRACNSNRCVLTEIRGARHGTLAESFGHKKLYDWLLAHSLSNRTGCDTCRSSLAPPPYAAADFRWSLGAAHAKYGVKRRVKRGKKHVARHVSTRKKRGRRFAR